MTTYIVTKISDGSHVYTYTADTPIEWNGLEFSTHAHTVQAPVDVFVPEDTSLTKMTKFAFRNRFTTAEKVNLEVASIDYPTADINTRKQAATLRVFQADLNATEHIDRTRPETRAGVLVLESFGLLAPGRALAILDSPITEKEAYNG